MKPQVAVLGALGTAGPEISSITPTGANITKLQFFNFNKAIPTSSDKKTNVITNSSMGNGASAAYSTKQSSGMTSANTKVIKLKSNAIGGGSGQKQTQIQ